MKRPWPGHLPSPLAEELQQRQQLVLQLLPLGLSLRGLMAARAIGCREAFDQQRWRQTPRKEIYNNQLNSINLCMYIYIYNIYIYNLWPSTIPRVFDRICLPRSSRTGWQAEFWWVVPEWGWWFLGGKWEITHVGKRKFRLSAKYTSQPDHSVLGGLGMFWLNKSPNYRATVNSGSINRYK